MSSKASQAKAQEPGATGTADPSAEAETKSADANGVNDSAAEAGAGIDAAAAPDTEPELPADPMERVAALEAELAGVRNQYLRALADAENTRRRAESERAAATRYGGVPLARSLLPVHDAFDRLMESIDDAFRANATQFVEGVELIRRELQAAFEKHGIQVVTPGSGDAFDPHFHQAMFKEPADSVPPGSVARVLQSGFVLGDRLLRPAAVSVAEELPIASREQSATGLQAADAAAEALDAELSAGDAGVGEGGIVP